MAEIDSLQISIKSEVTNATKAIDTLIGKIGELSNSIKSINVSSISSQVSKLTTSFKNINGGGFSELNRAAKEAKGSISSIVDASGKVLASINNTSKGAEQSLNKVSNAAKKVSDTKLTFNTSDYNKAIQQLSTKFSEIGKDFKVSDNLKQLEKQSSKLSTELDKLSQKEQKIISIGRIAPDSTGFIGLQYNISKTVNELGILTDKINQLKTTASNTSGIEIIRGDNAVVSLEHLQKELQRMDDLMQKVLTQSQINTFVSNLEDGLGKLKQLFPEQTQLIKDYKNKIESLKNLSVKIPEVDVRNSFKGIPEAARYSTQEAQKTLNEAMSQVHAEVPTEQFRNYTKEIAEATEKLKQLEAAGKGMGSNEWEKAYLELAKVKNEAKEYKNALDRHSKGLQEDIRTAKTLREQLKQLQIPEIKENNLDKLQNQLEKTKQKMASLKTELQNKLTMGKITASVDDSGYVRMREQIALTGKTISALQDRIKVFSDASEKVNSLGNRVEELKSHINNLQSQGFKAGDVEFDKATAALQRAEQELKQYKAILAQPSKGLQEDIQKTNSFGNHVEELRKKLDELKGRGLNFGDKEFDKAYSELQKAEGELSKYKSSLTSTQKTNVSFAENASQAFKKVSSSIGNMVSGAVSSLGKLGNVLTLNRSNLNNLTNGMSGFKATTASTISSVGSLTKQIAAASGVYLGLYGAIKGIKSSIDFASSLTETQNVINVTFGKSAKMIEDFAKTSIQQFGLSELSAKQTAGKYQAMGTALGIPTKQMANMSVELTKLSADMASFYDVAQSDVARSLQSVFTGTTAPMRRYGVDLTQTTLEEWAHKRGIDAKIKSMSQAEKMMLRYAYVMERTGAAQGDFERTIHTWHNQMTLLKENFRELSGVIGTGFINALKPVVEAINGVMGKVITFLKTVLSSLGKIFGWTYEDTGGGVVNDFADEMEDSASGAGELADDMDDVADSTDKAAKKQKEFNKQLSKFDELNNYTTSETKDKEDKDKDKDKDQPSIGDLADIGGEYGVGGEWKKSKSIFKEFESELDSLYKLGDYIGQKLTKAMENIDWDSIYEKARNFGSGLASFLNGLISPELFSALGKTVAGSINTALHTLDSFGETFNWSNFGNSLASGLNSFLGNIDWNTALSAVSNWGKGIADALNSFIHETDFALIGSSVAKFINTAVQGALSFIENFDFEGAGKAIATALNSFLHETDFESIGTLVASFINGVARTALTTAENFDFSSVGSSIASFINSALGGIEWKTILTAASEWGKGIAEAINSFFKETDFTLIGSTVGNFINTAINFVLSSGQELDFKEIGSKIADGINEAFKTIDFEGLAESINVWIKGALTTVTTLLQETDFEEIGKKIGTFLAELDFGEILGDIATAIWEAIKAGFSLLSGLIQEAPLETALITAFATLKFTGIGKLIAGNIASGISRSLAVALSGLSLPSLPVVATIASVGAALIDLWNTSETFRDTASSAFNKVKESLTGAFDKVKNAISPLVDSIGNLAGSLYDFYEGSPIKAIVDLIASLTTSLVGSALSTAIDVLGTAIAGLAEILTGAFDILSGFFDILTGIFTLDFSKAVDGFENLGKGIAEAFSGIIDLTAGIGEDIIGGLLKGIADGVKTIGTWIKNSVVDPIVNKFKSLFGIHSPSTVMAEIGGYLMEGLKKGIENTIKKVTDLFGNIKNKIVGVWNNIKTKTSEVWGDISNILSTKWGDFKNWASEKFSAVASSVSTAWDSAKSKTTEVWNAISGKASEVWGNLKSWASEKFGSVKTSIVEAWDNAKSKTTEVWNNVSNVLKTKWNDFKSWASDKFGSVKQSVIDAWNEAKKNTTSKWKEISDILSTKWGDFKSWASDKFGNVKDSVIGAWKEIKNNTSSKWQDVSDILSTKWGDFKSWASDKFGNVKDSVKGAWETIKTKTEKTWENKGSVTSILSDSWETIKSSVKDALTGKDGIVSKLSSAWDSIKTTAESAWKKIGNVILSPIEKAVNGVIKGINWVLDKVGSKTQFKPWSAPKFASGSSGLQQDTVGVVNDQSGNTYREMIVPPHGKPFIPKGRNVTLPLKKGTKIMPAAQTEEFIQSMKEMPHFAKGIGDFFGGAWSKIKEFTGNIWDYFSKPKEILQIAIDKFIDLPDIAEVPLEIAKGSVNTVLDSAVNYIKKIFESTGGGAGIERAISWALKIAADDSHGYDQDSRWGNPDYDCSSFVISAFEQAGIKLKTAGATYTGDMRGAALKTGFSDVTNSVNLSNGEGLRRGDILLDEGHHVALYLGNGQLVHASINEHGGITGGKPGDQNGREILTRSYYNHPWSNILRYTKGATAGGGTTGGYTSQGEPDISVNYTPSAGVAQWRDVAIKALQLTGQYTPQNLVYLLEQMRHESDGNPYDVNTWDINAKNGTPSKGLMQVIDPTFKEYAMKGYDKNIFDPLSNIIAAIRYTVSRYGSLYSGWAARGYKGYATGIGKINLADIIKGFAKGGISKDELGVVNDQSGNAYKELVIPPHGTPFIPEGRNVTLPLEKGTRIIPADKTKKFLKSLPHFADGTEDFSDDKKSKSSGGGIVDGIRKVIDDTIVPYIREMIRILEGNAKNSGTTVTTSNKKTTTKYSDTVKEIQKAWTDLAKWFETTVVQPIETAFTTMKTNILEIFGATNEEMTKSYAEVLPEWQETLKEIPKWITENIGNTISENFTEFCSELGENLGTAWEEIQSELSEIPDWFETNITSSILTKFTELFTQVKGGFSTMWSDVSISASQELEKVTSTADSVIGKLQEIINKANDAIATIERVTQAQNEAAMQAQIKQTTVDISNAVQEVTSQLGNSVISTAVASVGRFNNNIQKQEEAKQKETKKEEYETAKLQTFTSKPSKEKTTGSLNSNIQYTTGEISSVAQETANVFETIKESSEKTLDRLKNVAGKIKFKRYDTGGFPEDGWFRASKGEFMGQFDDGTSYVANNQQIQKAISAEVGGAVYNAVIAAMSNSGSNNGGDIVVNVDGESLFRIMKNKDNSFYSRTGRGAFEH